MDKLLPPPPPPTSATTSYVVVVPKSVNEGEAFDVRIGDLTHRVRCPRGVRPGDKIKIDIPVARVVAVDAVPDDKEIEGGRSGTERNRTKASGRPQKPTFFIYQGLRCFGNELSVCDETRKPRFVVKGVLKMEGKLKFAILSKASGREVCTAKQINGLFSSNRVVIKTSNGSSAATVYSGSSFQIRTSDGTYASIVGSVKERRYDIRTAKNRGSLLIASVVQSDSQHGMLRVRFEKDFEDVIPMWLACIAAMEKLLADREKNEAPKHIEDSLFGT